MPPYDVIREMAEGAAYDRDGEAFINTKHAFSFGAATCWFRVVMVSTSFPIALYQPLR